MFSQTFPDFEGKDLVRKIRIRIFKQLDHARALTIMIEAPCSRMHSASISSPEWPNGECRDRARRDRFRQIFVERQRPRDVRLIDATSIECVSRVRK